MFQPDTIAAIATAVGMGIGIVRVSGPQALTLLDQVFQPKVPGPFQPRHMRYGHVLDAAGQVLDEVMAVYMPGPHSFTGEDVVELQGHGGATVLEAVLARVLHQGARLAEAGEFTRRAFLNGRLDLTQAEAVAEMIAAPSTEGLRLASAKLEGLLGQRVDELRHSLEHVRQRLCLDLDFNEDEAGNMTEAEFLHAVTTVSEGLGRLIGNYERAKPWQDGLLVVLAGQVNAGKSSLMNALLGRPRAIVTPQAGTTRDYLEEQTRINGLPVRLVDTAGLRDDLRDVLCDLLPPDSPSSHPALDPVEQEGIRRSHAHIQAAQVVILVLDGAAPEAPHAFQPDAALLTQVGPSRCIVVWNKSDLKPLPPDFAQSPPWNQAHACLPLCARSGQGLEALCDAVRRAAACTPPQAGELLPNARQAHLLAKAQEELSALLQAIKNHVPADVCTVPLEAAAAYLADITGLNTSEDTLNAIFEQFCIGK